MKGDGWSRWHASMFVPPDSVHAARYVSWTTDVAPDCVMTCPNSDSLANFSGMRMDIVCNFLRGAVDTDCMSSCCGIEKLMVDEMMHMCYMTDTSPQESPCNPSAPPMISASPTTAIMPTQFLIRALLAGAVTMVWHVLMYWYCSLMMDTCSHGSACRWWYDDDHIV